MLTLPRPLSLSLAQYAQLFANNPEAGPELDADGTLIEMTPTGGSAGARNTCLLAFSGSRCDPRQRLDGVLHLHFQPASGWIGVQPLRQLCIDPKPAAGAAVLAQVIIDGQRLEAGLEFAGLRIDLVEIW